ncbi:hypothetical protein GCM10022224_094970 [Nonomuraea antimicrobica]|uniref:Uncharacterized protein n=2 Tax=Nonomuraea antimicrobica TaxID=561173 RepID=A0ABP7E4U4_9ACTN
MSLRATLAAAIGAFILLVGFAPVAQAHVGSHTIAVAPTAALWADAEASWVKDYTDGSGSTALATCKRWSKVYSMWMYYVLHHELNETGYVDPWYTNLTHSHLPKCS